MKLLDFALMMLPGLMLLMFAGLTGDALSRAVDRAARIRLRIGDLQAEKRRLEKQRDDKAVLLDQARTEVKGLEAKLAAIQARNNELQAYERKLGKAENQTVYEIGVPLANSIGYYCKASGPSTSPIYCGLGSHYSENGGGRVARMVVWGSDETTARKLFQQRLGQDGMLLLVRPFLGKLKKLEV